MFAYLKGIVEDITEDSIVVEVHDIGYNVHMCGKRIPNIGEMVKLYTYTYVKEDAFQLYGFFEKDSLDLFRKLITVNGIGPKGGMAVLSALGADELRFAILAGDSKAIAKAPGIGAKTAQRVILDLKDKISLEDTLIGRQMAETEAGNGDDNAELELAKTDAVEALTALGYGAAEALRAIKQVELSENMNSEDVLKAALKFML